MAVCAVPPVTAGCTAVTQAAVNTIGVIGVSIWGYFAFNEEAPQSDWEMEDAEARKDAQHARYHRVCDQPPPPPSGDACEDAKRKRDQAQLCYDLRKNWSDKWDEPGSSSWIRHQSQLEQVKQRISNAVDEIKRNCEQDC